MTETLKAVVREQVGAVEDVVGPCVDAPTPRTTAEPTPEALEAWAEWADVNMKNEPKYLGPVQLLASGYLLREIARRMREADPTGPR